ncbi:hypothetical protein AVEN_135173-1, partial [Araneus ventricosus]
AGTGCAEGNADLLDGPLNFGHGLATGRHLIYCTKELRTTPTGHLAPTFLRAQTRGYWMESV